MISVVGAWLLLAASARAAPIEEDLQLLALDGVVKEFYLKARSKERAGDFSGAERAWEMVLRELPNLHAARLGLVRAVAAQRRTSEALDLAERMEDETDVLEVRAELLASLGRTADAVAILAVLDDRLATPASARTLALARAPLDPVAAAEDFLRALAQVDNRPDMAEAEEPAFTEAAMVLADVLHEAGELAVAEQIYARLVALWPASEARIAEHRDQLQVEAEARRLARAHPDELTGAQRERLQEARRTFAQGRVDAAALLLATLVREVRRSPDVLGARADVREAAGDIVGAEVDVRRAVELAPMDSRLAARLGDLLVEHYAGRSDQEAAALYARALRQDPTRVDLWWRRARVEQRLGWYGAARASASRYLAEAPAGRHAQVARTLVADLDRVPPTIEADAGEDRRPVDVPVEAWEAYHRALVRFRRLADRTEASGSSDQEHALADLEVVREQAPRWVKGLNLAAAVYLHLSGGDAGPELDRARAAYAESLDIDPQQPQILTTLGLLADRDGDHPEAVRRWEQAVALHAAGDAEAHFYLARDAALAWRLWEARDHLDAYFAGATTGAVHDDAVALRQAVDTRIAGIVWGGTGAGGVAVLTVIAVPAAMWTRRRAGKPLTALLERAPATFRDVARIGSRIRHEVLKHNTTVLASVADALDDGDPDPAAWAADNLYGPRGAVRRFAEHVAELEHLGRAHGVRLNLRHRDPVFGPLIAAMDRLSRLEPQVRRGQGRRLASELREVSRALNEDGYRALGELLRRLCLLEVDEELIASIWSGLLGEPGLRDQAVPDLELELPARALWVRVFRGDLEDILTNVMRNGVVATLEARSARFGLRVDIEEDVITGLERVAFRVVDLAPRRITTAMIRSRYIDRGLGLTVDLISNNGGSIHVEDEAGWSKAVVVRLPLAEPPDATAAAPGGPDALARESA